MTALRVLPCLAWLHAMSRSSSALPPALDGWAVQLVALTRIHPKRSFPEE